MRALLASSVLAATLLAHGCGSQGEQAGTGTALSEAAGAPGASDAAAPSESAGVCPPCRMPVRPHYEVIEIDGLRFGICNPRCGEIVRKDPARFAADALP